MLSIIEIKDALNTCDRFVESKNYYYETHDCGQDEPVKVKMDYKLKDDINGQIVKFGFCPFCNTCYYHNDFEGGSR